MKNIKTRLKSTQSILVFKVSILVSVLWANPSFAAVECGKNKTKTFFDWGCGTTGNPIIPVLVGIFNWASIGVGIAVVAGIIYGAITYSSAGGSPERSKHGIDIIRNAIIALLLYLAMFAILNFLVPGGLFRDK